MVRDWITIKEASRETGVSEPTIKKWMENGYVKHDLIDASSSNSNLRYMVYRPDIIRYADYVRMNPAHVKQVLATAKALLEHDNTVAAQKVVSKIEGILGTRK